MSEQPLPGTCPAVRNAERAAPGSPIWPCTRWGFPCLRACARSGGLLPRLFTLTRASCETRAVFSLWHFPSARLAAWPPACIPQPAFLRRPRRLRGIAPYGVRTFLLPRIAPGEAILRPSKIRDNIPCRRRPDKRAFPAGIPKRRRGCSTPFRASNRRGRQGLDAQSRALALIPRLRCPWLAWS